MLNARYKDLSNRIGIILDGINQLLEDEIKESGEDREAFSAIGALCEAMETYNSEIEYLSKGTIEGQLHELPNEKFELLDDHGNQFTEFSCGNSIEIFLYENWHEKEIWQFGRVEGRQRKTNKIGYKNEYYFLNGNDNPALVNGMKARVRY